ncbi:hypothetical protein A33M_1020 [Rhodovulum sp. PH10]|uniref:phasin family protein n=1 Tax=Rhodovulum sp. PH10 TaxID=1187851 RepID=UPI00027C1EE6|nr:phasin family protein [Rhodovulum sp. PH10]EJW09743.1 hypothetical protein A33M_1020 [Rhodovulum sp. PH10]
MTNSMDNVQAYGKESMDAAMKSLGMFSKSVQAIALETADYSKRSLEQGTAAMEKILGAKSLDTAVQAQSDYLKTAFEGFIAQSNRMSELYADLAKEMFKPYEGILGKAPAMPFGTQAGS